MPMSAIAKAALAQGGSQAGSGLINGIFGWIGQRKQREHERAMYERQLADNRQNWELENIYNSPEAQIQRLKNAGLNPNLAYGNYSSLQSGSIEGANPQVSDQSKAFMPFGAMAQAPMTAINSLYDLRIKDAQANLLTEKVETEGTIQALNNTTDILKQTLQYGEMLKNTISGSTYQEIIKQLYIKTEQLQADLENTRADTEMKNVSANLAGSKKEGQDIGNELLDLERDLYKGTLNLPEGATKQLLQLLMFILKGAK